MRQVAERVRSSRFDDAVLRDAEFVRRFNQLRELGIYELHVYETADDIYAVLPGVEDLKGNR